MRAHAARVLGVLGVLEQSPLAGAAKTGSLKGVRALEFSLPGGEYRAVYTIHPREPVCIAFLIGLHENLYTKAERRWKSLRSELE